MEQLIKSLPRYDHFQQNWHYSQTNWLPFFWAGFGQTTRYTYRLLDLSDEEQLWRGLGSNIRSDVRKATRRFALKVRTDLRADALVQLMAHTFKRQGREVPYSRALVKRLDDACQKRNARRIFIAEDELGRAHAGVYIVWDEKAAYYLMGGGDPLLRSSGGTSLCMWEAIKFSSTVSRTFDFEGSMLEPVERFFRAFGAQLTPFFTVSRTPSMLIRAARCLREFSRW
jgi:hypothetical protein